MKPFDFIAKRKEFEGISTLEPKKRAQMAAVVFTRVAAFTGLKGSIDDFNKQDIMRKLIFSNPQLSLEELDYAFMMDRYGEFGDPTPHYQIINAEYVSKVVNKYQKWLAEKRLLAPRIREIPEITENERKRLDNRKIIDEFNSFFETKRIPFSNNYRVLYKRGLLPDHTPEFISEVERVILGRLKEKAANLKDLLPISLEEHREKKEILLKLEAIKNGTEKADRDECRGYILENFYNRLIDQKTHISQLL